MKTSTKLCLALCGLALALFQPLTAQAQDPAPYFKNTDGRVTFLVDANPGGNARNEGCPVKLGGKTAQLDIPSFKINGQLWDLMGSLVQVYYAKYTLGDRLLIPVSSDNMATMDIMTNAPSGVAFIDIRRSLNSSSDAELTEQSVTWHTDLGVQKHYKLKVSSDLFDKIAISSQFHMEIRFERGGSGCVVSRGYSGILGKAGEWGWDVPGSPNWDKAFADMNHEQATNYWQTLKTENHNVYAKVNDLSIYLGDFMAALRTANPDAADKLGKALSGYPPSTLTDQPAAGLADLQKAAGDLVAAWASGKPITDDLRTAAARAIEKASTQSWRMKGMATRLSGVLKLANSDASQVREFVNSLGMKFVPVPGTTVKFCIWDVRVQDFETFIRATGHDSTQGMWSLRNGEYGQNGATWQNPGFSQAPTHPVVGVNWEDAKAFCEWLSKKEGKTYRLPTDAEWSVAAGLNEASEGTPKDKVGKVAAVYPWGTSWPPPSGAGNYSGSEASDADWPSNWKTIEGYRDDYPRTSPVGSFAPNKFGLYDMGGNVWQWCEDWYSGDQKTRVERGASWRDGSPDALMSSGRGCDAPDYRIGTIGFRCVLEN